MSAELMERGVRGALGGACGAHCGFQCLDFVQDALAASDDLLTVGREAHVSRRAVKELHAELCFEPRHALRHCGGR